MFRLDEDVAAFFKTPQEVNEALRLVIQLTQVVSHKYEIPLESLS